MPVVGGRKIYEVQIVGQMGGQETRNIFYYVSDLAVPAADILTAWDAKFRADWEACVSLNWQGVELLADELTSLSNFANLPIVGWVGLITGDTLPPQSAFDIKLLRASKETRNGRKRICGVPESGQSSGNLTAGQAALLQTLAAHMDDVITVGIDSIEPIILRRTFAGTPPVLEPIANWIYNDIAAVATQTVVTTQNTRKYRTS